MRFTSNKNELVLNKPVPSASPRLAYFRREWYRKWNRVGATITCVLIFLLMMGMGMQTIWRDAHRNEYNCNGQHTKSSAFGNSDEAVCDVTAPCSVVCSNIDFESDFINHFFQSEEFKVCSSPHSVTLTIRKSKYSSINQGWIHNTDISIVEFTLEQNSIKFIEEGAFGGSQFETTTTMTINNNDIKFIRNKSFATSHLRTLNIYDNTIDVIENSVSEGFKNLETFQFQRTSTNADHIVNLTGGVNSLPAVVNADFRYNSIEIISSDMFNGIPNVQILSLTKNNIREIQPNAFSKCAALGHFDIAINQLTTIPDNAFHSAVAKNPAVKFGLDTNPWDCICSLQWLKNIWLITKYQNPAGPPECSSPELVKSFSFNDANFCSLTTSTIVTKPTTTPTTEESTTKKPTTTKPTTPKPTSVKPTTASSTTETQITTKSTPELTTESISPITSEPTIPVTLPETSLTTEITTAQSSGSLKMLCKDAGEPKVLDYWQHSEIELGEYFEFSAKESKDNQVVIKFANVIPFTNFSLIWANNDRNFHTDENNLIDSSDQQVGCRTRLQEEIVIDGFLPGNSYTICVFLNDEPKVTPFSCQALTMSPDQKLRSWILQKDKVLVLTVTILIIVICTICGGFVGYLLVRSHPSLLRGSKRVVLISHNRTDAIVFPKKLRKRSKLSTPRPPLTRSASDSSIISYGSRRTNPSLGSNGSSYVTPAEPSPLQLLEWRLDRMRERWKEDSVQIEEQPPPLPPHPGRDRTPEPTFTYTLHMNPDFTHRTV